MALLIFDLDNTLYSSESFVQARSKAIHDKFKEIAKLEDHEDPEDVLWQKIKEKHTDGGKLSKTHIFLDHGCSREDFFKVLDTVDPRDHMEADIILRERLESLKKEHELVLLSNSPMIQVEKTVEALGLKGVFSKAYGADLFEDSKPDHSVFKKVVEESGARIEECISIGDSLYKDLKPSKELGMKTILLKKHDYPEEDLKHADKVINHIHEIGEAVREVAK